MPHEKTDAAAFASPPCLADHDTDVKQLIENLAQSVHNLAHTAMHEPWYACDERTCVSAQESACVEAVIELPYVQAQLKQGGEPLLVEDRLYGWVTSYLGAVDDRSRIRVRVRLPYSERGLIGAAELGFLEDVRVIEGGAQS